MDFRHLQRGGDVMQLLPLLAGDAIVGKESEIGDAEDLFLAGAVEARRGSGELREQARPRLGGSVDLLDRDRMAGIVLVDLLNNLGLDRRNRSVRSRDRDHRLQEQSLTGIPSCHIHFSPLLPKAAPNLVPGASLANAPWQKSAFL